MPTMVARNLIFDCLRCMRRLLNGEKIAGKFLLCWRFGGVSGS